MAQLAWRCWESNNIKKGLRLHVYVTWWTAPSPLPTQAPHEGQETLLGTGGSAWEEGR